MEAQRQAGIVCVLRTEMNLIDRLTHEYNYLAGTSFVAEKLTPFK